MPRDVKRGRFPRAAFARRIVSLQDQLRLVQHDLGDEYQAIEDGTRRQLLQERIDMLEALHDDLDACLRSLQYWR